MKRVRPMLIVALAAAVGGACSSKGQGNVDSGAGGSSGVGGGGVTCAAGGATGAGGAIACSSNPADYAFVFQDPCRPIEDRISDLLAQLTTGEKQSLLGEDQ